MPSTALPSSSSSATEPGGGILVQGLRKVYGQGATAVEALKQVDLVVGPGEVVGLVGPSGSGKSTLLKCLGAIIEPTSGRMVLGGKVLYDQSWASRDLSALRRDHIGFVFQAPYLIPFLDVTDNVALLPMLAGVPNAAARSRALELLNELDMGHRAQAAPSQLSGGEQQRVSIARALANRPAVILADEPTAPLDSERALGVMRLLGRMARQSQAAVIVVTHDEKIIPTFQRLYHIRDGRTVDTLDTKTAKVSEDCIIKAMVGRELTDRYPPRHAKVLDPLFEVKNWNVFHPLHAERQMIKNVNFHVCKGEVVGIAGLMGAGRTELAMSLFGHSYGTNISGSVKVGGKPVDTSTVAKAVAAGLSYVTEDRKALGLVLELLLAVL